MVLGHIIRGWGMKFGLIPTSQAEAKLSELRLKICANCPLAAKNKVLRIINGNISNEAELYCTKCTCPCIEKSLVIEETCPINNW